MPASVAPVIRPVMISPLKGRKTINRNSTKIDKRPRYQPVQVVRREPTVDINHARAMSDETVRSGQDVIDTDAETDFLYYLILGFRRCKPNSQQA